MWRTTTISLRRCFSTSAAVRSVYELSIDTMKPSKLPTYVNAVGPLLNSSNSKPLGSFTTFLGGQRGEFIYIREHGRSCFETILDIPNCMETYAYIYLH